MKNNGKQNKGLYGKQRAFVSLTKNSHFRLCAEFVRSQSQQSRTASVVPRRAPEELFNIATVVPVI